MTKKDYELIASAVYDLFLGHEDWQRSLTQVSDKLAEQLQKENTRFDGVKFKKACRTQKKEL